MKKNLYFLFLIMILTSCVEQIPNEELSEELFTNGSSNSSTSGNNDGSLFAQAYRVLQKSENTCFNCHSNGYKHGDFENLKTEEQWLSTYFIQIGKPEESLLIQKIQNYGSTISTMPKISDQDFDILKRWIASTKTDDTVIVAGPSNEPSKRIAGLNFFLKQLKFLFLDIESDNARQEFQLMSLSFRNVWGGSCDFYRGAIEKASTGLAYFSDPLTACQMNHTAVGPLGRSTPIKSGLRINICERMVNNNSYMNYFYESHLNSEQDFTKAKAEKVFRYFYTVQDFDSAYTKLNASMEESSLSADQKWRTYLSVLCQSLIWETY